MLILCINNIIPSKFWFCRRRMSGEEALNHQWLKDAAMQRLNKANLKKYVIKRRWIKAANTIIALQRMGAKLDDEVPTST